MIETLDTAARQAATALTGAVPEYKAGMSPAAVSAAVRDATLGASWRPSSHLRSVPA